MVVSSAAGPVSAGPSCALREASHQRAGPIGCSARAATGAPSRVAGPFAAPLRHVGHFAQAQQRGSSRSQALPLSVHSCIEVRCSAGLPAQAPESVVPTLSCVAGSTAGSAVQQGCSSVARQHGPSQHRRSRPQGAGEERAHGGAAVHHTGVHDASPPGRVMCGSNAALKQGQGSSMLAGRTHIRQPDFSALEQSLSVTRLSGVVPRQQDTGWGRAGSKRVCQLQTRQAG